MITSTLNPKVQWVRALQSRTKQRRKAQAYVVEGVRLVEEALASGWAVQFVMFTGELDPRGQSLVDSFIAQGTQVEEVTPQVMRAASDTQTPQGILAVVPINSLSLPGVLDFVFIADGVRDPGNLGTMLRTAAAAGVNAVFTSLGTVDVYAPKVVRAAMGAHFRLPIRSWTWEEISLCLRRSSSRVYLASSSGGKAYSRIDFHFPLALIVGGEAEGAGESAQGLADTRVHIPMTGSVESLNAAVAAAVLLFEIVRQGQT